MKLMLDKNVSKCPVLLVVNGEMIQCELDGGHVGVHRKHVSDGGVWLMMEWEPE